MSPNFSKVKMFGRSRQIQAPEPLGLERHDDDNLESGSFLTEQQRLSIMAELAKFSGSANHPLIAELARAGTINGGRSSSNSGENPYLDEYTA